MTETKIGCVQHDCEKCKALEAQVNTCGSGAGCLHKDARIEALEGEVERLNTGWQGANALLLRRSADLVTAQAQLAVAQQAQPVQPSQARDLSDAEIMLMWSAATTHADVHHKTEHECLIDFARAINAKGTP